MKKETEGWIRQAENLIGSAQAEISIRPDIAYQNAYRAGEFAIKALFIEYLGQPSWSHDIDKFIKELRESGLISNKEYISYSQDFSELSKVKSLNLRKSKCSTVQDNYPSDNGTPPMDFITEADAREKIIVAKNIFDFVKRKLQQII